MVNLINCAFRLEKIASGKKLFRKVCSVDTISSHILKQSWSNFDDLCQVLDMSLDLIFVSHELADDLLDLFDGSGDDLHDQVDLELRWNDPNILRSENKINFQML